MYLWLALLLVCSLSGLLCLRAIQRREQIIAPESTAKPRVPLESLQ
jgi:hypothetical protein